MKKYLLSFGFLILWSKITYCQGIDTLNLQPINFYCFDTTIYYPNSNIVASRTIYLSGITFVTTYRVNSTVNVFVQNSKREQIYYQYDCSGKLLFMSQSKRKKITTTYFNVHGLPVAVDRIKGKRVKNLYNTVEYARDVIGSDRMKCLSHIDPVFGN